MNRAVQESLAEDVARQQQRKRLADLVGARGLKESPNIDAVGNCLYDAVRDQLQRKDPILYGRLTKEEVRERAKNYCVNNAQAYREHMNDPEFDRNVEEMGKANVWGDDFALQAICGAFGIQVLVIAVGRADQLHRCWLDMDTVQPQVMLGYEFDLHFWSLIPIMVMICFVEEIA